MITEKKKKYASFTEFFALNTEKKPTSKLYFSETNDPIFKKKSLHSNFVLIVKQNTFWDFTRIFYFISIRFKPIIGSSSVDYKNK